ncbi:hypothetical protein [Burkholderia cenocepacia]|uniref:hypothetical protein n=1 Tax=Burkholderia cenocepacia TaxID=95486 RepID=UPI0022370B8B|nr:hypothetical protein [Burkholderia cenocepacia]MCW5141055.1 hypothetical protein [Burkholderia cenocepacia]
MAYLLPNGRQQFIDFNGNPLVGGRVFFYEPNTEDYKTTWQDSDLTIPNANPVVLDARGQATIWGDGSYRQVVYDRKGNLIWDQFVEDPADALREIIGDLGGDEGAANIGFIQLGVGAVHRTVLDKLRERVTVDDYYQAAEADWTGAFERGCAYLRSIGGGVLECPGASYVARRIVIPRGVLIEGRGVSGTVLRCAAGANADFIVSENFDALTGSGLDVAGDGRVPSWFGLRNVRVYGNRAENTQGRGVAFYGANPILDDVLIENAAGDGLYTEYATTVTGQADWHTQEEGYCRNLVSRENGGVGWRNRGPHNILIDNPICCFNDDWGYVSEIEAGKYNGAPTYASVIHCYSNDMKWTQDSGRARRNMYIGTNMSCSLLVVDGSQCEIRGSSSLIGIVKQYFGGQGGDSLILSGSDIKVGTHYGIMRNDGVSQGSAALRITGNYNQIGTSQVIGTLNRFDGVVITGVGNSINDLIARDCRVGLTITGSQNRVRGLLVRCLTGFSYTRPTDTYQGANRVELRIYQTDAGTAYVAGDAPIADRDVFDIQANGLPTGPRGMHFVAEIGALPVDTDVAQQVTVAHGLLWPCRRRDVRLTMTGLSVTAAQFSYWRVRDVDAANVYFEYRCIAASNPGTQVSFALEARVN